MTCRIYERPDICIEARLQLQPGRFAMRSMRSMLTAGMLVMALAAMPIGAQAGTLEGVAIGAGSGALIAGPPARWWAA